MKNDIWVEKYRPKKVKECILPKTLKTAFLNYVKEGSFPNMLFIGRPGTGKTTIAKALCNELDLDYMIINGSDESGIDTFRGKVKNFATTISFNENPLKCLIIDEADYLNPQSFQPAMRSFMEEYSKNCRFILTGNYKQKIIEPLLSRLSIFEFTFPKAEKLDLMLAFGKRAMTILKEEKVEYDENVVASVVAKNYPDFRKCLSELEKYAKTNDKIDVGILSYFTESNIRELLKIVKEKNFSEMRKWVVANLNSNPQDIIRQIFDYFEDHLEPSSRPALILILAQYQYQLPFVADPEIHLSAMITEIMANCVFKNA